MDDEFEQAHPLRLDRSLTLHRPAARFSHFASDQLALIFRVNIEPLAGSLNRRFFAGGGDDTDVGEAIALLSVNTPNARLLP